MQTLEKLVLKTKDSYMRRKFLKKCIFSSRTDAGFSSQTLTMLSTLIHYSECRRISEQQCIYKGHIHSIPYIHSLLYWNHMVLVS